MNTILVPTDFSQEAIQALELAVEMAKKNNAEIKLLHVIESPGGASFSTTGGDTDSGIDDIYTLKLIQKAKKDLRDAAQGAGYDKITTDIDVGSPYNRIARDIAEHNVDLVIMGSKGVTGLEETFVGSNAEIVVRRADCPVITVKSAVSLEGIKSIVFAGAFEKDTPQVADRLKKLQALLGAQLHLVKVNTPYEFQSDREIKKAMKAFADSHGLENYSMHIYSSRDEEDGIIYFAEDNDMDMIALATHGRTGLMHLLSGSIAEDVVNHAKRPVWTCKIA